MNRGTARLWSLLVAVSVATSTTAQTTFTWTGNAASVFVDTATADLLTPGNWAGNLLPVNDGTATGSNLVFGGTDGVTSSGWVGLGIDQNFAVRGLTFTSPRPYYYFDYQIVGEFGIGPGGITVGGANSVEFDYSMALNLLASQTWHTEGNLYVYGEIRQVGGTRSIVKTGPGELVLDDTDSTFSGGLDVQAGTLAIGGSSEVDGVILNGPVGQGALTLRSGTTLRSNTQGDLTLHNPLLLGNGVTLGLESESMTYRFEGTVTPLQQATTINIGADEPVVFAGAIGNAAAGATALTFATPVHQPDHGVAVLAGVNTYTGGTVADRTAVIFTHAGALPATGNLAAINAGYLGTAYDGGMAAILARIASPAAFDGSLGFDTDLDVTPEPTFFADPVNLSAFNPDHTVFRGLGTLSAAELTGAITPPTGGEYVFGGGDGYLVVHSNLLAAGGAGVRVQSEIGAPLTVVLRGANTFTGHLKSDHSIVILDSAAALPTGTSYQLDDHAYVGYTENFTATPTPAAFLARLNGDNYSSTSVLGFDTTAANRAYGRTIADPVNLSAFTDDIYVGSATKVYLDGTLTAPATGILSLTGVRGGELIVTSNLAAANVASVRIGLPGDEDDSPGLVLLASGASNYTGNTAFHSGILALASSSVEEGAILQGPVGRGTLAVTGYVPHYLAAVVNDLTLHNPLTFDPGTSLMVGVPVTEDPDDPAYPFQDWTGHDLTLGGPLTGQPSTLRFTGNATFRLEADNGDLTAGELVIGDGGHTLVVAAHDRALGDDYSVIRLAGGGDLEFTTSAPAVGVLKGGDFNDGIFGYVVLAEGTVLTVNQHFDSTLTVNLGGQPLEDLMGSEGSEPVNAELVKNGSGKLTLDGASFLTGGLTVNQGTVHFGSLEATAVGPITLNGGSLSADLGVGLDNPISFGEAGGRLTGSAVFTQPLTAGANVVLAPGDSPGVLSFAAGLTLGPSGTLEVEIAAATGTPGWNWDLLAVSGALAEAGGKSIDLTATPLAPFTLTLTALGPNDTINGVPIGFDASLPYAWNIAIADEGINGFSADKFFIDSSLFSAAAGGTFGLSVTQLGGSTQALTLNFTPVPEPSALAFLGSGLAALGLAAWRRRRSAV